MKIHLKNCRDALRNSPHFDPLLELFAPHGACLVGGAVRDALTSRSITDYDLVTAADPTALAQSFARRIGGHWFWLDRERRQSRVVVNHDRGGPDFDFAPYRAVDLVGDLLDRDFTINAIALDLTEWTLIDPCNGCEDLRNGLLRMAGDTAFAADPLRVIKGVRHAATLELEIEAATLESMRRAARDLAVVAVERVRQEIWKIFASRHAARGLQLLDSCGAGECLFGPGFGRALPEMLTRLDQYRVNWHALASGCPVIYAWRDEEIEQGLNNETLLLWCLLLQRVDAGLPVALAADWLLSRRAGADVRAITAVQQESFGQFRAIALTERAFAWWAQGYRASPRLLLLALAAVHGADSAMLTEIAARVPVARLVAGRPRDLVDGNWLLENLGLAAGPDMSRILERLRAAEVAGLVRTHQEAQRFLLEHQPDND